MPWVLSFHTLVSQVWPSTVARTGVRPQRWVAGGASRAGTFTKCHAPGPGYRNRVPSKRMGALYIRSTVRIAVVCNDTRGGIQPYVALALGLRAAGHEVRAVAPTDLAGLFTAAGLPATPLTGSVEEVVRASGGAAEQGSLASMRLAARELPRFLLTWTRETLAACEGVDVLTGGIGGMVMGLSVADRLRVPFVEAQLQPIGAATDAYPGVLFPGLPRWLGGWARRASHALSDQALWMAFAGPMRKARKALGLEARSTALDGLPALYGFSRHVVPLPERAVRPCIATGYWVLAAPREFRPPPGLEEFLARPGPVVSVGFGSMASEDPRALTQLVLEAVRAAGVRAVLVAGWGGLTAGAQGDDAFAVDSVPYDWLFPRMAAVVHHGGAGTTGAGLTAGVPSVVVPFMMDQPWWGARVAALGAGPAPIPRKQLSAGRLAAALRQALADGSLRAQAAELGSKLRAEDGVGEAVRWFERLGSSRERR